VRPLEALSCSKLSPEYPLPPRTTKRPTHRELDGISRTLRARLWVFGARRGYPRWLLRGALAGARWLPVVGCLYGRWDSLGEGGDDVVAPAYLFGPTFQLPLEERYAVAEVGDGLVFGFQ
jgi:hypothetical protein